ncbi:hypothetical protein HDU96_006853 [Phlyctochytrium bullatum]|nr:hypothetical protein HDU96_006853 [Phlyctochytrium bullatum]
MSEVRDDTKTKAGKAGLWRPLVIAVLAAALLANEAVADQQVSNSIPTHSLILDVFLFTPSSFKNAVGDLLEPTDLQGVWNVEENIPGPAPPPPPPSSHDHDDHSESQHSSSASATATTTRRAEPSPGGDDEEGALARFERRDEGRWLKKDQHWNASGLEVVSAGRLSLERRAPHERIRPCKTITDVTWDISGNVWKRSASVPDRFNSNGRYYIRQVVKGVDMDFVKVRATGSTLGGRLAPRFTLLNVVSSLPGLGR